MTIRLARAAALALMVAAFPGAALAQQPAAPAPAPSDTIPIPQATPAHMAAARELVVYSGLTLSFEAAVPDMMRQLTATVTRTRPELNNDMRATMEKLQPEFMKLTGDIIENSARIYTALLSEQECKDAAAFFKSNSGKKFVEQQRNLYANIGPLTQEWTKFLSNRMYEMAREEMKKKGHQI